MTGTATAVLAPPGNIGAATPEGDNIAQMMALAQAQLLQQAADLVRPVWVPFLSKTIRSAGANADTTYGVALLEPGGSYRISGRRGTVVFADLLVGAGLLGVVERQQPNVGVVDFTDLDLGDDDTVELILSAERPAGYDGHWFRLDPTADHVWLRQYFYDWETERPWSVTIERLDVAPTDPPKPALRDVEINGFVDRYVSMWQSHVAAMADRGYVNRLETVGLPDTTGMVAQSYFQGVYEIAEDEALLLEVRPPRRCRYWSVQLTDDRYISLDWMWRQTSLNGHQARLDPDGVFRAVISHRDPGVHNWLDAAGWTRGTILGRWNRADANPVPSVKLVDFADLPGFLPADVPRITSDERRAQLRARAAAAQRMG